MIKKFEEFVSEGLWSKTVNRAKTGEVRKEEKDGLTDEEYNLYKEFYKFYKQGEIYTFKNSEKISQQINPQTSDLDYCENLLHNIIKKSPCVKRLYEWKELNQSLKNGEGVIYSSDRDFYNIIMAYNDENETLIKWEINGIYMNLNKHYQNGFSEYARKYQIPYNAYQIPKNILIKIFEQQPNWENIKNN